MSIKKFKRFIFPAAFAASVLLTGCSLQYSGIGSETGSAEEESEPSYNVAINYPEKDEETTDLNTDTQTLSLSDTEDTSAVVDPMLDAAVQERLSVQLITESEYSRPGDPLTEVNNIVVHYLGNPGTTAQENRDYFDSLAYSGEESASTHFIIGLDGEIIQLIPLDEISYCSNDRNYDTIAIECCHPDESGVLNDATYDSLVLLTAWLLETYELDYTDIIRHYDVTGKICPRAFVENPDYYYGFKADVANTMGENITAEDVAAVCNDDFMDPEEVALYFAEEESGWQDGHGGGPGDGGHGGPGGPGGGGFGGPPD